MQKKTSLIFKGVKKILKFFYPKMEIVGLENITEEPVVFVGNHTQLHGPITSELYFPEKRFIWCAGQMMNLKEVPAYAYQDFWSQKPKYIRWFFKIASYIIAPLSVFIFNNAATIAVYRDARIIDTFKNTIEKLKEGANIIIFPEHDVKYNNIIYDFQDKFIHIAKMYHKQTGKDLSFMPTYFAPNLKKVYVGKPICYCASNPAEEERRRVCDYLMEEITQMARKLPKHIVVPYRNIPKKYYPYNTMEVNTNEKTSR